MLPEVISDLLTQTVYNIENVEFNIVLKRGCLKNII